MGTEEPGPEQKNSAPSAFQIKYLGAGAGGFLLWFGYHHDVDKYRGGL